jgi:hypothetical protein
MYALVLKILLSMHHKELLKHQAKDHKIKWQCLVLFKILLVEKL